MALINRVVLFIITVIFIITLLIGATTGFAKDVMGLGIGTRSCTLFLDDTNQYHDDGTLKDLALFKRLEYLQWAYGFMAALNIRYYEKNNEFKKMNSIKEFRVLYDKINSSCKSQIKNGNYDKFSLASYFIFDTLPKENINNY